ncbi:MAG: efflux RND transporter periplasmic adaptor subunit [Rhodovarius sp.]|nr:efflux RND transporter periplasmic adaptor subunit [Rhodovarius sp.]MDW8313937.1 efflux RND transporter periplasmic adaptor subunit [Rhodovarius sp.]
MRRLTLLLLALAGLGGTGLGWFALAQRPQPAPPAAQQPVLMGVGALGRVEPAGRIRKLQVPGAMNVTRLAALYVREGDEVVAGQLLAEFADAALKDAEVQRAEAALAEARANLERVRNGARPSEIAAQRARIAALAAVEENARREAQRSDRLAGSGAAAEAAAERNRFLAARTAAERAEAEAVLETLLRPRPEDVAIAEARVAAAEGALAKARADAALSRVYAPISGTILRIAARPGDQVGSEGLLEMADLSAMDVVADVFETDLPRIAIGQRAEVIVPGEAQRFTATVREIGWLVRRTTQAGTDPVAAVDARTVEVRLTLSEEGRQALMRRSNMQVQVAIRPLQAAAR